MNTAWKTCQQIRLGLTPKLSQNVNCIQSTYQDAQESHPAIQFKRVPWVNYCFFVTKISKRRGSLLLQVSNNLVLGG